MGQKISVATAKREEELPLEISAQILPSPLVGLIVKVSVHLKETQQNNAWFLNMDTEGIRM